MIYGLSLAWPQPQKRARKQNATQLLFLSCFMFIEVGTQVSLVTMSRPSPRTVAPPLCLPLNIKDLLKVFFFFFFDRGLMEGFLMGH
jgi:hypothetical protein